MASIALCVICKNEKTNFPQLLESVKGCFDEIHATDTGSTDGTVELLEQYRTSNPADSPLFLHHFEWCNDFAAARNASFSHAKTEYVAWLDLDDVLSSAQAFREWRDSVMPVADYWLATYHYGGLRPDGSSPCRFMRERVIRNGRGFHWRYFVHEGIVGPDNRVIAAQYATSWDVVHKRTDEDVKKDRSRNLKLFEGRGTLPPRMRYYYGKELFENSQVLEAFPNLIAAAAEPELEPHDRVMALQYACMAAMQCGQIEKAIQVAHQGLQLAPNRAEFHVVIGDGLVKQGKIAEAAPFYAAAKTCQRPEDNGLHAGHIFSHADSYTTYPRKQLARCYVHTNRIEDARAVLNEGAKAGLDAESAQILAELDRMSGDTAFRDEKSYESVWEIAITCLPGIVKDWDEDSLQSRGLGGSETAVIHMARALHELTNVRVRVFNDRKDTWERDGVVYEPLAGLHPYFRAKLPLVHVSWRHNVRLNPAPQYIWCHDLSFLGVENPAQYEKVLALSEFHKNWLTHMYRVDPARIAVTRNGIDPARFRGAYSKVPGKVIYSSSPDRGLERAIRVMAKVREHVSHAELHCFYGFDGMRAMGRHDEVARLEQLIAANPFVKMHGNVTQAELTRHMQESEVWLYPTNFLETFCITAIEALCCSTYPVARKFGALADTLAAAQFRGMADLVDMDCESEGEVMFYAHCVVDALREKKWQRVIVDPTLYSWKSVAADWVSLMGLPVRS